MDVNDSWNNIIVLISFNSKRILSFGEILLELGWLSRTVMAAGEAPPVRALPTFRLWIHECPPIQF